MRILITNGTLAERSGTALYVRDLAGRLRARGDTPIVYTPMPGEIADEITRAGVEVVSRPGRLSALPDLIHGHHEIPTMEALLAFPRVPAVFVCHDRRHHSDIPPTLPRVRRYVAVDYHCRERLLEHGIAGERIRVVPNGVDLQRFRPRGPLPARPRRALVFGNNASERTHVPLVRQACARAGVSLDVIGAAAGKPCAEPEAVLGRYDVVFAKGRCAIEAAAVGAAVILCDALGTGPLVTRDNLDMLRRSDGTTKQSWFRPLDADLIFEQIARYDAGDAAEVSRRARRWADLDHVVRQLVVIYGEVLAEHAEAGGRENDDAAIAAYWRHSRWRRLRSRLKRLPGVGRWLLTAKQTIAPYRPQF
jgi:hypothetical protein